MKTAWAVLIIFLNLAITPLFANENISQKKLALIKELLKQTHQSESDISQRLTDSYQKQISSILKQSHPNISSETLLNINHEVSASVKQQLIEQQQFIQRIIPIYDQAFSLEELQKIVAFNQTEFGEKLLSMMPVINNQHSDIYDELALDLAPEINARVLAIIE